MVGLVEISMFLTELQRGRGVSQKTWAARSGLSRATLWRWRKGKAVPRIVELTDALDALSVTRAERKRAFFLLMRARSGRGSVRTAPLSGIPVIRGDLLRTLRVRNGWTQEEAATRCGFSQVNLSRWERNDRWPDAATLQTVTLTYDAHPEEVVALNTLPGYLPDLTRADLL